MWRLELGSASSFVAELAKMLQDPAQSKEQVAERRMKLAVKKRAKAWSAHALTEHVQRLRDLIMIRSVNGAANSAGKLQTMLDDLLERGAQSDYASVTFNTTFSHLLHSLKKGEGSKPNYMNR